MALARAAAESALRSFYEEGGAVQVRLGHGVERVLKICTITESVSVKSSLIFGKSLLMWR